MKKIKIILVMTFIIIQYILYENIINRPFPFIEITYNGYKKFNAKPNNLDINITLDINSTQAIKFKKYVYLQKINNFKNLEDDILATTLVTRKLMHQSIGNRIRKLSEVIDSSPQYKSICSESSKIFAVLMQSLGYSVRVIWMKSHTVSEVYTKKYGWVMVDTYENIMFKNNKGAYQGLLDIKNNFYNLQPFSIVDKKYMNNPDTLEYITKYPNKNKYSTSDLFVIIDAKSLDNFHFKTRQFSYILDAILFNKQFAKGIQYIGKDTKKVGNVGLFLYKRYIK